MNDLIDNYLAYMEPLRGSVRYHRFNMLTVVSALLERRVWLDLGRQGVLFPNMYTLLVGLPATGKTWSTDRAVEFFDEIRPKGRIEPYKLADKITQAALYQNITSAKRVNDIPPHGKLTASPMFIHAGELGKTMEDFGGGTLTNELIDFYDSKGLRSIQKKDTVKNGTVSLYNPSITFLGCTTQESLQKAARAALVSSGLSSRMIFVVENNLVAKQFRPVVTDLRLRKQIVDALYKVYYMKGAMTLEPDALERYIQISEEAHLAASKAASEFHGNYFGRKNVHVAKMACCFAAMRGSYSVTLSDIERAATWIAEIEPEMIDAFGVRSILYDENAMNYIMRAMPPVGERISIQSLHRHMLDSGVVMPQGRNLEDLLQAAVMGGKLRRTGSGDTASYEKCAP